MAAIVDVKEMDSTTRFMLDDGRYIDAEYGFSVGAETGCHNFYGTRTQCTFYNACGDIEDKCGFECSLDDTDGEYDWDVWENEIKALFSRIGWTD